MAIIYADRFETSLQAPLLDTDTWIDISAGAVALLNAAFGWPSPISDTPTPIARIPLFLDNGTNWEQVWCVGLPGVEGANITRPGTALAFAAGTTVRCAPPAAIHACHATTREVAADAANAIPGEEIVWTPATTGDLTLSLPHVYSWSKAVHAHTGDEWPARVVIANGSTARTVFFMDWFNGYPEAVWMTGLSGGITELALPATAEVTVLTIRKIPLPIRSDTSPVIFTLGVEHFG